MKKIIISYLVVFLLLATFVPVLAKSGGRIPMILVGTIDTIEDQAFKLEVLRSSKAARGYIGYSHTIQISEETSFLEILSDGKSVPSDFHDLVEGDVVSVTVRLTGDKITASRITRQIELFSSK